MKRVFCLLGWVALLKVGLIPCAQSSTGRLASLTPYLRPFTAPCSAQRCSTLDGLKECILKTADPTPPRVRKSRRASGNFSSTHWIRNLTSYPHPAYFPYAYTPPSAYGFPFQEAPRPRRSSPSRTNNFSAKTLQIKESISLLLDPTFTRGGARVLRHFIYGNNRCTRGSCPNVECYRSFCRNVCAFKKPPSSSRRDDGSGRLLNPQQMRMLKLCSSEGDFGRQARLLCYACPSFLEADETMIPECQSRNGASSRLSLDSEDSTLPSQEAEAPPQFDTYGTEERPARDADEKSTGSSDVSDDGSMTSSHGGRSFQNYQPSGRSRTPSFYENGSSKSDGSIRDNESVSSWGSETSSEDDRTSFVSQGSFTDRDDKNQKNSAPQNTVEAPKKPGTPQGRTHPTSDFQPQPSFYSRTTQEWMQNRKGGQKQKAPSNSAPDSASTAMKDLNDSEAFSSWDIL